MISFMDFTKEYVLEDDTVRLSPLTKEHLPFMIPIASDPDIWPFFIEKGIGVEGFTSYIASALKNRDDTREYPFVVYDKIKQQYAGLTRWYEYSAELNTIKLGHTWYGKEFRGTGINKHCKYLLFEFAFEIIGVERIGFGSYVENTVSIKAMKSVGCKEEGRLRAMFPSIDGEGRSDAILLSILKEEWDTKIKERLKRIVYKSKA
jgi:RimJ/RimL family protein N-acetyltransferase